MADKVRYREFRRNTLLEELQCILQEYPDNEQIIKELLQNAEDAGASVVKMAVISSGKMDPNLPQPYREYLASPAICFYNDGEFTDEDWEGITMVRKSIKRENPLKVGRFGLGFKSVFHITDYVTVISGRKLLFINPLKESSNPREVCGFLDLKDVDDVMEVQNSMFPLYKLFGMDGQSSQEFQGTMFWFPLRSLASDLSQNVYPLEKCKGLFRSFRNEAPIELLFCKSLERVELYNDGQTLGEEMLNMEFSIGIDDVVEGCDTLCAVRSKREEFRMKLEILEEKLADSVDSLVNGVPIEMSYVLPITSKTDTGVIELNRWLVVHCFHQGNMDRRMKKLIRDAKSKYRPYMGIAAPICSALDKGEIFCLLPLPSQSESQTGLPVHVNGFLALDNTRNHIKWATLDQESSKSHKDDDIVWNELMVRNIFPKVYIKFLEEIRKLSDAQVGNKDLLHFFYRSLPSRSHTKENWINVIDHVLRHVLSTGLPCMRQEMWLDCKTAVFAKFEDCIDETIKKSIIMIYEKSDLCTLHVGDNEHVYHEMKELYPSVRSTSPQDFRNFLRTYSEYKKCSVEEKGWFLSFSISDGIMTDLEGLELIPLSNSEGHSKFESFRDRNRKGPEIFLCEEGEEKILIDFDPSSKVVETKISKNVADTLKKLRRTGSYQLNAMNIDVFANHLRWTLSKQVLHEQIAIESHQLGKNWLQSLWSYLKEKCPSDLTEFEKLPIVPTLIPSADGRVKLCKMVDSLISYTEDESDVLWQALYVLGIYAVSETVFSQALHPNLYPGNGYVRTFSSNNVKTLLDHTENEKRDDFIRIANEKWTYSDRMQIVDFMKEMVDTSAIAKQIIMNMNIFQTKTTLANMFTDEYISIQEGAPLYTGDSDFPVEFPSPYIVSNDTALNDLARKLGAVCLMTEDVIMMCLDQMQSSYHNTRTLCFYTLENKDSFINKVKLLDRLNSIIFVKKNESELEMPSNLFRPDDTGLQILFAGEDMFPFEESSNVALLLRADMLLTRDDVKAHHVLSTCLFLNKNYSSSNTDNEMIIMKATKLIEIASRDPELIAVLTSPACKDLRFIPNRQKPPSFYPETLPWFQSTSLLFSPSEIVTVENSAHLVGSVVPVISPNIPKDLQNIGRAPNYKDVIQQLQLVLKMYRADELEEYKSVLSKIYKFLNAEKIPSDCFVEANLPKRYILLDDKFVEPQNVYCKKREEDLRLDPYLNALPADFKRHEEVFTRCKEYDCFIYQSFNAIVNVLQQVRLKHRTKRCLPDSEVERDINICKDILTNLWRKKLSVDNMEIVLPIQSTEKGYLVFANAKDCSYCGNDWLSKAYRGKENLNFVHQKIPKEVAEYFGVKSVKQKISNATDMLPQAEFGQSEDLTTRLRNILSDGYTDGFSVPKEIVQNADDAGATVVRFLYDERENKEYRSFLLDDEMKECQGPALWAYNDKEFSKNDFDNIQKIGGTTKKDDTTKIGRFGLGFNAVYNITDVPCFVSGNNIAYFDPHRKFLKDAFQSEKSTGILLDLSQSQLMTDFQNQFHPFFNVFGYRPFQETSQFGFNGTLFRFHLRTKRQAEESKICHVHYSRNEMIKLLRLFYESAGNLLLFTQNVQEISLHHLQNDSIHPDDDMVLVFKVDKQELFIPRLNKRNILTTFTEASKKAMREERSKTKQTFICRTNIRITNSCGLADVVDGGKDGDTFESEWLISWSLGVGKSFRMYIEGGSDGALPLTAVALPISEKGNLHIYDASLGFYRESHLFVFLPIPVKVPFSVHINGCFAVSADRKRLLSYTSDDKTDSRQVTWNSVLISDSLLNSYLQFLAYVRNNCLHDVSGFYYLWPKDCGPENTWKPLLKEFYKHVVEEEDLKMFFGFRNKESVWLTFDECTFLDESFSNDSKICSLAYTVLKCLSKEHNICPTELPQTIRKAFVEAGLSSDINRKTISIEAFYEIFLKNIANIELDLHDKERLVIHALRQENKNIMQHLMTNACITSKPKGNFHLPSEMVLPNSPWKSLFDTEDERFPSDAFCREDILKALQNLGMKTSEIPWDLIRLQARKNENINTKCTECARERAEIILKYIHENRRSDQACPKDVADDISDIEFIPAMTKSAEWKWKWKADECLTESKVCCAHELSWKSMKLNKPKNMYISNLALQVGCSDILTPEYFHEYQEDLFELGVKGEEQVGIKTLREQLLHVTESHLCSENVSESLELRILEAVFKSFESRCHDDEAISFLNEFLDKPVIKIGKRFVSPCSVVFSLKHDCSPFLYGLDNSPFLQYKNTLEAMGVRKQFDFQTLKFVLKQLKDRDEPLDESEIGLACRVALLLEDVELDDLDFLYLPDSEGILRPTTELCIDDCSWVPQSDTMKFLHGTIPPNIAKITKIRSKRNHDITEETSEFGIDFGQHENLTNRLKRILDGYPDVCIMKELLQNADDAGATELHFIKDFRELGKESVFSEEWKDLQGPALCVYNDSVFSERDLEGIQNLGIGSNREDLTTIGKYGVGFNAVYHLTDVPSFLSKDKSNPERDTLCVLDPHCRYIPCATKRKPGRRFKDPSKTKQKYPDVFSGYLEDSGVWCENSGTMFRFPLRQACSDISPSIDIERFNVLIEQFKHEMAHSMMFLHNVRRIIISSIDKDGELHKEHFADSKISGESGNAIYNTTLETRMKLKEHKVSMSDIQRLETKYIITLTINGDSDTSEELLIVQRLGFVNNVPKSIEDAFITKKIGLLPSGGVAIPLSNKGHFYSTETLDHWNYVKQDHEEISEPTDDMEASLNNVKEMHVYCYLPLPVHSGLPVHINGHFALDHEARRNVWWPEEPKKEDLKKEWNAFLIKEVIVPAYASGLELLKQYLFASSIIPKAMRKLDQYYNAFPCTQMQADNIWKSLAAMLYNYVIENRMCLFPVTRFQFERNALQSVPRAMKVIKSRKDKIDRDIGEDSCHMEWVAVGSPDCPAFYNDLYRQVRNDPLEKYNPHRKTSLMDIYKETSEVAEQLGVILKNIGLNLLDLPSWIFQSIVDLKTSISEISPVAVLKFMKTFQSSCDKGKCKIEGVNLPIKDTVLGSVTSVYLILWYCALDLDGTRAELEGCPLLVTADEYLRVFSQENVVFVADKPNKILPSSGSTLVHKELINRMKDEQGRLIYPDLVQYLTLDEFSRLFPLNFNTDMPEENNLWIQNENRPMDKNWMRTFWSFIAKELEKYQTSYCDRKMKNLKSYSERQKNEIRDRKSEEFLREGKQKFLAKVTTLLGQWRLFPVKNGNVEMICRLDRSKLLVFDQNLGGSEELIDAFSHLQIPKPDSSAVGEYCEPGHKSPYLNIGVCFVANFYEPVSVLNCLYEYRNTFRNLPVEVCNQILAYFGNNICKACVNDESLKQRIRSLPLFVTMSGATTSIEDKSAIVLPSSIPETGIETWINRVGKILLFDNEDLRRVHTNVGCVMENPLNLYCKWILPSLSAFPVHSVIDHIQFIKQSLYPQHETHDNDCQLKNRIREAAFVIISDKRYSAEVFFDPSVELFKTMCLTDELPPAPFSLPDWREFMKFAGMKHELTEDVIISLARRLENEEQTTGKITETIAMKSKVLLQTLQDKSDECFSEHCLKKLSKIRIILPYEICSIRKGLLPSLEEHRLVAFSESTTQDFKDICWSSYFVIPRNADPKQWSRLSIDEQSFVSRALQIKCPPPRESIIQHIKNILKGISTHQELLRRDIDTEMVLTEVMQSIYTFLSESFLSGFSHEPIIYIKDRQILSCAPYVVLDMNESDEIPPYLLKAPLVFGKHFKLFEKLGASKSLSCNHFAKVLETIYNETKGYECLHAEELTKVKKAVQNLFRMLNASSNMDALTVDELYLPSKEKILLPCKELIFVDDTMIQDRIKQNIAELNYFVGFSALELKVDDPVRYIKLLPEKLQPTMLSKTIKELIPRKMKDNSVNSAKAKHLGEFLGSSKFLHGVLRLLMHKRHKCDDILTEKEQQEIKSKLLHIDVIELQVLETCLYWNDHMLPDTNIQKKIFLELTTPGNDVEDEKEKAELYFSDPLDNDLEEWIKSINIELSQYINVCTGQKLEENVLFLSEMLKYINNPNEIQEGVLDRYGIVAIDISFGINEFVPKLGSTIPIKLHHLLNNSFSFYDEGEYIALEIYDPFIDDENTAASLEDDEEATIFSPVYILARIIERLTLQDKDVTEIEYKLDIGESFETAKASRIYKFVRKEKDGDSALDYVDGAKVMNWNMDAAKKYILSIMKDAAKKPKSEMRRIVKRLLLQYHPDKHTENKQYFTELTQFIQYLVSKIERGESLDDVDLEEMQRENSRNYDSTFCEGMFRRGRRYAEQRSDNSSSGSSFFDAFRHVGPQPGQARRWIRQAEIDLRAANNDSHDDKAQNWVCYKCHQASEKALKALLYKVGTDDMVLKSHRLPQLASSTQDAELIGLAGSLEDNTGSYFRMRYPDTVGGFSDITGCRIPSDIYTRDQAERAVHLATSIVQLVLAKL